MTLKNLQALIEGKKQDAESFEQKLLKEYNMTLWETQARQPYPKDSFRPSSLPACSRNIFFMSNGVPESPPDFNDEWTFNIIGITDNGTSRHETIQKTFRQMPNVEHLDIEELCEEANQKGISTKFLHWDSEGLEGRCYNADLNIYFQPDGAFRFDDKEVLLEIKTASMYKFKKLTEPLWEHKVQATAYAMGLGMDYVLFFYEDRNFLQHKLYLWKVTDDMKEYVRTKVDKLVFYKENNIVPPAERDKCMYCKFKELCNEYDDEGGMVFNG